MAKPLNLAPTGIGGAAATLMIVAALAAMKLCVAAGQVLGKLSRSALVHVKGKASFLRQHFGRTRVLTGSSSWPFGD
jgi:hypothetical protein